MFGVKPFDPGCSRGIACKVHILGCGWIDMHAMMPIHRQHRCFPVTFLLQNLFVPEDHSNKAECCPTSTVASIVCFSATHTWSVLCEHQLLWSLPFPKCLQLPSTKLDDNCSLSLLKFCLKRDSLQLKCDGETRAEKHTTDQFKNLWLSWRRLFCREED
jgi:hypothetical protein